MKYNLGKEFNNIEVDENKLNEIKELFGLVIRVLWTIVAYITIIWAIVYGIQLVLGLLQILNEKENENENYNRN